MTSTSSPFGERPSIIHDVSCLPYVRAVVERDLRAVVEQDLRAKAQEFFQSLQCDSGELAKARSGADTNVMGSCVA